MTKVLLLGGYPKGFAEPFAKQTLSGKRLRTMVANLPFEAVEYVDLWENEQEEINGLLWPQKLWFLEQKRREDFVIVALGHRVAEVLKTPGTLRFTYLPHPASRRKRDINRLKTGLRKIAERL